MAAAKKKKPVDLPNWSVTGELALNCNCDVFCPCVVSLGQSKPSQGYCQAWMGVRIDEGRWGDVDLGRLNVAALLDIPGRMGEGGWTVGLYIDELADEDQANALEMIFSGQARGTTGLFALLVSNYLGAQRMPVTYDVKDGVRTVTAGKKIMGQIKPIDGAAPDKPVVIQNTGYWMGPNVVVAQGLKSKVRDFGRVWNFDGLSGELCEIEWSGP